VAKTKIQHYVPRFYLKNFSKKKKGEFFLNCFDKSDQRQFEENIRKIGSEKYFYDVDNTVLCQHSQRILFFVGARIPLNSCGNIV
jgi:hypothetical protein